MMEAKASIIIEYDFHTLEIGNALSLPQTENNYHSLPFFSHVVMRHAFKRNLQMSR
jgi:hypothetical protein